MPLLSSSLTSLIAPRCHSEDELPFLITHLSLYPVTGERRVDANWQSEQGPPILYGNLVSAVDVLEDLQGNMGLFFLFPDVSIRWQGRFRLRVSLLKIGRRVVLPVVKNSFIH